MSTAVIAHNFLNYLSSSSRILSFFSFYLLSHSPRYFCNCCPIIFAMAGEKIKKVKKQKGLGLTNKDENVGEWYPERKMADDEFDNIYGFDDEFHDEIDDESEEDEDDNEDDLSEMEKMETKIEASYYSKSDALLEETKFKVLVQLMGSKAVDNRSGVDIVVVLHVSRRMLKQHCFQRAKEAIMSAVKLMGRLDRLSIVVFAKEARRVCPLRHMTSDRRSEINKLICDLDVSESGTNITAGLEEALRVLEDRNYTKARESAVMLVSHGKPYPSEADGSQVPIHDVPVYTFCLDENNSSEALLNIAKRSKGGTFSITDTGNIDTNNLTIALSQCLAGLLTVVVQDLSLTVTGQNSKIENVYAGKYPQSHDESDGSVTISFGNLYRKEIRNILVHLILDDMKEPNDTNILCFTYSYRVGDEVINSTARIVSVRRTIAPTSMESREIRVEEARQYIVKTEKEAKEMVDEDDNNLPEARLMLIEAETNLVQDDIESHPMVQNLQYELDQFVKFFESVETYSESGRQFALAVELSHALQRFAARGKANKLCMFATFDVEYLLQKVLYRVELEKRQPKPATAGALAPVPVPVPAPVVPLCGAALKKPKPASSQKNKMGGGGGAPLRWTEGSFVIKKRQPWTEGSFEIKKTPPNGNSFLP